VNGHIHFRKHRRHTETTGAATNLKVRWYEATGDEVDPFRASYKPCTRRTWLSGPPVPWVDTVHVDIVQVTVGYLTQNSRIRANDANAIRQVNGMH